MHVLFIKLSSLGDVVHSFPALSDAARALPDVTFDWAVEEGFAPLAALHPSVQRVIPVSLRRLKSERGGIGHTVRTLLEHRKRLRATAYDHVVDAQGLLKSAGLAWISKGPASGLDAASAREGLAAKFYAHRHSIAPGQHAIDRTRKLMAASLGYRLDAGQTALRDWGLDTLALGEAALDVANQHGLADELTRKPVLIVHGTAWETKHWDQARWRHVCEALNNAGRPVWLPAGSEAERQSAHAISEGLDHVRVLPSLSLDALAALISQCGQVAGVDSGLTHLAEALGIPGVMLLGPTDPLRTGPYGSDMQTLMSDHPEAPCYNRICTIEPSGRCCMDRITEDAVINALMRCRAAGKQDASS